MLQADGYRLQRRATKATTTTLAAVEGPSTLFTPDGPYVLVHPRYLARVMEAVRDGRIALLPPS